MPEKQNVANQDSRSKEDQLESFFRDFTTNMCNILQGCLADQFPVMDQKLREQFLRNTKTLKRNIYKMFALDWEKGRRDMKEKPGIPGSSKENA